MFARCWRRIAKRRAPWEPSADRTGCWPRNSINAAWLVSVIENALVLAAARRLIRPADTPPLATVRSLAYFLPVIEEVLDLKVSPDYFQYLRHKLARIAPIR